VKIRRAVVIFASIVEGNSPSEREPFRRYSIAAIVSRAIRVRAAISFLRAIVSAEWAPYLPGIAVPSRSPATGALHEK